MKITKKRPIKNQLAEVRKSRNLAQLDVAKLLGHKTSLQLSRWERGIYVPTLKTALKLAQIYNLPVRAMLDEYFMTCREEVRRQEIRLKGTSTTSVDSADVNFCSYEVRLSSKYLKPEDLDNIRSHSTRLIRKTSEKLGQI